MIICNHMNLPKTACRNLQAASFLVATQVYKPGSVLTAIYLLPQSLTGSSRLLETVGPTYCFSTALLRIEFTAPQCSHGAGGLLPRLFTMTGKPATYLCCTCPGVTPGRRYLLSLPCGARTFLTWRFSPSSRGCPTWSRKYCNAQKAKCQISLQNLLEKDILYVEKSML